MQQRAFGEVVADQLQPDRHVGGAEAGRDAHPGQAGEARRQREDVGEVVGDRIVALRAERPRDRRRDRTGDDVAGAKARLEVVGDHAPELLRLQVVGVVVAVRKHVGADHDAALDLGAEAFAAARAVHLLQVAEVLGAVAVAHAVEARQVRRRFRRRDQVVDRDRQLGARQLRRRRASRRAWPARRARRAAAPSTSRASAAGKNSFGTPMRSPSSGRPGDASGRGLASSAWKSCGGRAALVESRASNPLIAPSSSAQSSALRASTPAWSRLDAKAIIP